MPQKLSDLSNINKCYFLNRCEVRPGPEFILRKYNFLFTNQTFDLVQWFYADRSCRKAVYAVKVHGHIRHDRSSWLVPGRGLYIVANKRNVTRKINNMHSIMANLNLGQMWPIKEKENK